MPSNPPYDDDWSGESRNLETGEVWEPSMTPIPPIPEDLQEELAEVKKVIRAYEGQFELHAEERVALGVALKRRDEIERIAKLTEEVDRLKNPITLTETLAHSRTCSAGHDLEADCTCGLDYRIQLQTSQNMHAAWMKRATEAEAENTRLKAPVTYAETYKFGSLVRTGGFLGQIVYLDAKAITKLIASRAAIKEGQ